MLHFNIKDTEKYNQACNNLNQFRDDNDNKLGAEYDVFLFGCSVGKVMSYFKVQVYYDLHLDCHHTTHTKFRFCIETSIVQECAFRFETKNDWTFLRI